MPYGFYPPPNPYFLNPTGMQWAGGLPPQAGPPVPGLQPNPTAPGGPQKHIRGPHILAWLQYIFSNEKNNSLPFDLRSHDEYVDMRDKLQPFVIPKILANGKPSKSVRKLVTVQLFNRGLEGVSGEKGTKVSKLSLQ